MPGGVVAHRRLRGGPAQGIGRLPRPYPTGSKARSTWSRAWRRPAGSTRRQRHIREGIAKPPTRPPDIAHLKRRVDAGAACVGGGGRGNLVGHPPQKTPTQFFFEPTHSSGRDACVAAGSTCRSSPGILPIENWAGARKFAESCGTAIPQIVSDAFENATRDGNTRICWPPPLATELWRRGCCKGGVAHTAFYTLNKAELTRDVCHAWA